MIHIGHVFKEKIIADKIEECGAEKLVILGDPIPDLPIADCVSFNDSIQYVHYYRLLQKIDAKTLVVWNHFFRTTNRYALNYNCARRYFQQTPNRLIFEPLPLREHKEDFMILWDMAQPNPFLKMPYESVEKFSGVHFDKCCKPYFAVEFVYLPESSLAKYAKLKAATIAAVKKDPDIIPRRLLKFSEAENERITGRKFDSKAELKPYKMHISVNQTGVDEYYLKRLSEKNSDIEEIINKSDESL